MAANEVLAERMRDVLAACENIEERRMFGGLCFLMNGNMLCGDSGSGGDRFDCNRRGWFRLAGLGR